MQRRQRRQHVERRDGSFVKHDGTGKLAPAMHDTMARGDELFGSAIIIEPAEDIGEQAVIGHFVAGAAFLEQLLARWVGHHDARRLLLLVEQALAPQLRVGRSDVEQAELDAG